MPQFVRRSAFHLDPKAPTKHVEPVRDIVRDVIALYQQQVPNGEDHALFALAAVGEARTTALGTANGRTGQQALDYAKKAIGYLVAVELADLFGADNVLSERSDHDIGRAHSRTNTSGIATWVTSYSRHRVIT